MGKKSAPLTREIRRQIPALPDHCIICFRMEQMQRNRVQLLILLAACRQLCRSIVKTEGMQNFFDKIIVQALRLRYRIESFCRPVHTTPFPGIHLLGDHGP
ncbi:hypothetical protein D3C73_703740 [compost metagenome]